MSFVFYVYNMYKLYNLVIWLLRLLKKCLFLRYKYDAALSEMLICGYVMCKSWFIYSILGNKT